MTGRDAAREGVARAMRTTLTMSSMISRLRVGSTPMLARGASVDAISRVVAMRRAAVVFETRVNESARDRVLCRVLVRYQKETPSERFQI
jgi:hypothetical protein